MDFYAGLDVSLRSVAICIVDDKGKPVFERSASCEVAEIVTVLDSFGLPLKLVGFEAGGNEPASFLGPEIRRVRSCLHGSPPSQCCALRDAQ